MVDPRNQYFSKTLEKAVSILSLFDRDHTRLSLSQAARLGGLNKTPACRLAAFQKQGIVQAAKAFHRPDRRQIKDRNRFRQCCPV